MKRSTLFYNRRYTLLIALFALAFLFLQACNTQSRGFVLPDGDAERGKALFVELQCNDCHSIADIAWAGSKEAGTPQVALGGTVTSMKAYGELVTSVINPSHKISKNYQNVAEATLPGGRSKMEQYNYNEVMTVDELIDIVAFLQSEYKLVVPDNPYPYYYE
jgi:hypothetical protein